MELVDVEVRLSVESERLAQLMELFAAEWWTAGRRPDDVAAMLTASDLVFALVERSTDRLVGFARVLTDGVYLACVLDVIVASHARGSGIGRVLLDAIVDHPRLAGVRSIELVCQPELMPFYRNWGFTEEVGRSRLMRRSCDPRLAPAPPPPRDHK
ncbi:GNAT family N-acetyltransferase [Catellatospora paridis]|uniref:GNAT family N-acetyltransferase n=1 Tax=Catellatospora paridis TaxID=1617086 RepID=UPI0012D444CE|nr:GNAT family N-acetyltransferase [Catellatospora paridis]